MDNPLLSALQDNYGGGQEPSDDLVTVRGLLAFCKKWPSGGIEAGQLNDPCLSMAGQLQAAAKKTEADLAANSKMVKSMADPIRRMKDAFVLIASILEELPDLAEQELVDDYLDALDEYEAERQAVLDCQKAIQSQVSGDKPLCPRCASNGQEVLCPKCEVHRLFPDPKANEREGGRRANLAGVYVRAYQAYLSVGKGERTLSALFEALVGVETHLRSLLQLGDMLRRDPEAQSAVAQAGTAESDTERLVRKLAPEIKRALGGIERIRCAEEHRSMSEINRGWDDIFDSAIVIEGALRGLRVEHGGQTEEGPVQQDSVTISGE